MRQIILRPTPVAAALLLAVLVVSTPLAAQVAPALPLESRSERIVDQTNRTLSRHGDSVAAQRQRAFEDGQFRQELNRLRVFPRVSPPPVIGPPSR